MKKRNVILACVVLLGAFGIVGTYAYFANRQMVKNTIYIGNNTIEVDEEYEPLKEITVGENSFKKKIQIKNTGNVDCYVRVFCEFSDPVMRSLSEIQIPDTDNWVSAESYVLNLPEGWVYISDGLMSGYYYYTKPVAPGLSTTALIDQIRIPITEESGDLDKVTDFEIIVYAESVQTKNSEGQVIEYNSAWTDFLSKSKEAQAGGGA